jgi:hypothetical protein
MKSIRSAKKKYCSYSVESQSMLRLFGEGSEERASLGNESRIPVLSARSMF